MLDKELKTLEIDGATYRIVKMTPFDANWIWTRVVVKGAPVAIEQLGTGITFNDVAEGKIQVDLLKMVPLLIERLTEKDFEKLQSICLSVCRKLDSSGGALPIFDRFNNRFLVDAEAPTYLSLTFAAMVENLRPFFTAAALKGLFQAFKDLLPQNLSASTLSFLDRS